VANVGGSSVVAYANGAHGNATPVVTIAGSSTGLSRPFAIAFDSNGRLLIADERVGVLVFAAGANGNVAPVATITGFVSIAGIIADKANHIWVADFSGGAIEEFASNASGPATPIRTIKGSKTGLNGACFLAFQKN
jgi:hypothetical protein